MRQLLIEFAFETARYQRPGFIYSLDTHTQAVHGTQEKTLKANEKMLKECGIEKKGEQHKK